MIEPVLREIRNYFFIDRPVQALGVAENVIQANTDDFEVGQYVYINNHNKLTGVYKIANIEETGLRIDGLDDTEKAFKLYPLAVPKEIERLAEQVEQYMESNPDALTSQSLGDYSVSYSNQNGVSSWQAAFSKRLESYRSVYLEMPR